MGEPTSFDITWCGGAYRVSIPNYSGGTVYTAEHVARLTRENEAMRKALEQTLADLKLYGLDDFDTTTDEAIARIESALLLKEPANAQP
jgi:hypothetical protein